jgi:predicted small secreted protein
MSDTLMRRLALVLALGLMAGSLGACNTLEGFGEDVETAGEEVEEAAE